jgi:hypothetical protein
MRPIGWGLAAALFAAVLAPVAVISAPKALAPVSDAQRKQGMSEAPAVVQAAGLSCQVSDARFIGKSSDPKTKAETSYYEVACGQNMGYIVQAAKGGAASAFSCAEVATPPGQAPKEGALTCVLPGNSDPKAQLAPLLAKAGVQCVPEKARGIGQNKENTFLEVQCQGGTGYVLVTSAPLDPGKPVQAQNCLNFDANEGSLKCTLSDKATRLAVVDRYVEASKTSCAIKDRRFVGTTAQGADFFETACQDGKGYMFKVANGQVAQTWPCAQASNILGGCTLTDARQATAEQAALYTKLAHESGSNCDVDHYALFPMRGNDEVVELACKSGDGAVGIFPASGKGQVLDCGRALAAGYQCSLSKGVSFAGLTEDLKKFGKTTCTVSNARVGGKTSKGTVMVEVACADKLKGYMIEYNTAPTITAVGATGCAFAGGCQLPGNV